MIGGHAKSIAESYNPQCVRYIAVSLSEQFNSWVVDVGATISKYTYVRNQCADYVSTHICKLTYIHEWYAAFKQGVQTLPFVGHICPVLRRPTPAITCNIHGCIQTFGHMPIIHFGRACKIHSEIIQPTLCTIYCCIIERAI